MTIKIKQYDRQIQQLTQTTYTETQALLKVQGIGHITALTYVLTGLPRPRGSEPEIEIDIGTSLSMPGEDRQIIWIDDPCLKKRQTRHPEAKPNKAPRSYLMRAFSRFAD